ncbi:hypothetical protein BgAZ_401490 [Babesia gibsoni]|uniref:Uncharacterized protein n=1 Tax=Babesia gibsoni TaxID=33632 RepID=A0AAD8LJR5_BABGI|nr:hypothetical protein BgAZ_401490 [Babesia gibsoni]
MYRDALKVAETVAHGYSRYLLTALEVRSPSAPAIAHMDPCYTLKPISMHYSVVLSPYLVQPVHHSMAMDVTVAMPRPPTVSFHETASQTPLSHIRLPAPCTDADTRPIGEEGNRLHQPMVMPTTSKPIENALEDVATRNSYVYQIGSTYLFNKIRTDTKNRKRAFAKRGYFRQTHAVLRKENRMKYAYALQGIDYEMLENLKIGEILNISDLKR